MILAHKIRLYPTKEQEIILQKSCNVSRFVYNWGLNYWNEQYQLGNKTNFYEIKKYFNSIKKEQYPFVLEVSKCCVEYSLMNLNSSFQNFFRKTGKHPAFHKKGRNESFSLSNDRFVIKNNYIKLPKIKNLFKLAEPLRFNGKIMSATISKKAGKWYISIGIDTNECRKLPKTNQVVGIDLGIKEIATCSNGLQFGNPKWIKKTEKKLKRKQRQLVKQKKESKRRERTKIKIQKIYQQITNQRLDYLHKMTTYLIKTNDVICLEDLNTKGMLKNHKLAKAISNVSFYEIKRQLEYKSKLYGKTILYVGRFFPSSKICSNCGCIKENLTLKDRIFICEDCGFKIDRDINASINIVRQAMTEFTHWENQNLIDYKNVFTNKRIYYISQLDSLNSESNEYFNI